MSKQLADAGLVDRVALAAADFGTSTDEVDAAVAAALRVNRTDLRILGLVVLAAEMTAGALATAVGLSPAATTAAVQRLVAGGHLVRDVDPDDRRRTALSVTGPTTALLGRAYGPVSEEGRRTLAAYPLDELTVVERFLRMGIALQRAQAARIRTELGS